MANMYAAQTVLVYLTFPVDSMCKTSLRCG